MIFQTQRVKPKVTLKGLLCIFVNGTWHPMRETVGFGGFFKNSNFLRMIQKMKKGEVSAFSGPGGKRCFKIA